MSLIDGLIHYWTLDEASGTRADSVGGAHLTPVNSPTVVAGKIGNAVDLEEDSTQYFESSEIIDWSGDFTFACWVKAEELPAVTFYNTLVHDGGVYDGCGVEIKNSFNGDLAFIFFRGNPPPPYDYCITHASEMATVGNWDLFIATHDATAKKIEASSFGDDGVLRKFSNTYAWTNAASHAQNFRLGVKRDGTQSWDGLIDEVGIWNRVLSDDELTSLYNNRDGLAYPFGAEVENDMSTIAIVGSTFTYYLPGLEDQANPGKFKAAPTIAAGDFTISTNGGAFDAMDNTPTVAPAGGKQIKFILSAAETTAAGDGGTITIECSDVVGAEWFDVGIGVSVRSADLSVLTAAPVIDEVIEGTTTLRQLMRGFAAVMLGKSANSGADFRDLADSKTRVDSTLDANGNRTAVTLDLT